MPAKRKGPVPSSPNYEANRLDLADHVCSLHTLAPQPPEALRDHLEQERDHYLGSALIAGIDPVSKKEVPFPGSDVIEALLDRGIAAACAIADGRKASVHASIHVHRHDPRPKEGYPEGDKIEVSVTLASAEDAPSKRSK
jgi:hypothetical protein